MVLFTTQHDPRNVLGTKVGEEDFQMFSELNVAVNLLTCWVEWVVLLEGLKRTLEKQINLAIHLGISRIRCEFSWIPIVGNFVVVPGCVDGSLGQEVLHFLVTKIVHPVLAEFIKSIGGEVLGWIVDPNSLKVRNAGRG